MIAGFMAFVQGVMAKNKNALDNVTLVAHALSDPGRVRVIMFLRDGELCLCQISGLLGLAASTLSRHLSVLIQAGFVKVRKDGKWRYYSLNERMDEYLVNAADWLAFSLNNDATIKKDRKLHEQINKNKEKMCGS